MTDDQGKYWFVNETGEEKGENHGNIGNTISKTVPI